MSPDSSQCHPTTDAGAPGGAGAAVGPAWTPEPDPPLGESLADSIMQSKKTGLNAQVSFAQHSKESGAHAQSSATLVGASATPISGRDIMGESGGPSATLEQLCVFDTHTERPLYLGRSKRIASADQRIVLHNKDRGCALRSVAVTAPGCDIPGYFAEVHHLHEWADGGLTNVDELTFGRKQDHKKIKPDGWRTRKRKDGRTECLPPPHLPIPGGTNTYHHPERMLPEDDE